MEDEKVLGSVEQLRDLAVALAPPRHLKRDYTADGSQFVVIPQGYELRQLDHLMDRPRRQIGSVSLHDEDSFCRFVNDHCSPSSRIYAVYQPAKFVAVFDEPTGTAPAWAQNRAVYSCPNSAEWKLWTGSDGKPMKQPDFARFIEDNLPDVILPTAGEMLEIARTLEARKQVNFGSSVRLENGQTQLTYEETIKGTAAKGAIKLPEAFEIAIPVHEGGPKYALKARLRYRIPDGGGPLAMWYDLLRAHKIEEQAVLAISMAISAATEVPILRGERP